MARMNSCSVSLEWRQLRPPRKCSVTAGEVAIIRRRGSNEATHVALVVSVLDDESVETIEGNTTNPEVSEYCVSKKTRFLKADRYEIMGFARIIQED